MDERRGGDAHEGEREGEDGVRDLHEVGVRYQAALTREHLPVHAPRPGARGHGSLMPSFAHFSLTARRVPSSITISPGHSRVNPSSGHFFVASIPIFEP